MEDGILMEKKLYSINYPKYFVHDLINLRGADMYDKLFDEYTNLVKKTTKERNVIIFDYKELNKRREYILIMVILVCIPICLFISGAIRKDVNLSNIGMGIIIFLFLFIKILNKNENNLKFYQRSGEWNQNIVKYILNKYKIQRVDIGGIVDEYTQKSKIGSIIQKYIITFTLLTFISSLCCQKIVDMLINYFVESNVQKLQIIGFLMAFLFIAAGYIIIISLLYNSISEIVRRERDHKSFVKHLNTIYYIGYIPKNKKLIKDDGYFEAKKVIKKCRQKDNNSILNN